VGGLKFLVALMPQNIIPAEAVIRLNTPVLGFTLGVAVLTALVFGLVPALKRHGRTLTTRCGTAAKGSAGDSGTGSCATRWWFWKWDFR